ncbi:hypothetical protein QBC36DRAFT_289135 [Triangularia setosa]|uniref:Uncharacterized protein n=1 Tax=Triangularia setosa TaxID=2587417 RepID=A0AAN7A931_9PEZI|nr:hypothetical protein QBC36DRAFT_289135 [Podospora setosa]
MPPIRLENLRRTVENGQSCWHADLGHFETALARSPISINAEGLCNELVKLLRRSSDKEGNYDLEAVFIQSQFEWSSKAKLLEQQKSASQLRKKVYKWRNGLQDLHKMLVEDPRATTKDVTPIDVIVGAWSVYVAVCAEINGRPFYNSLQLFVLAFVSYMLIRSYWVIPFIGFGYAVSCCEQAYKLHLEDGATNRREIVNLLQNSMDEVPDMYKRAQHIESQIAPKLNNCYTFPPAFFDFIMTACTILREPGKLQRKNRLDEMVPRWIELLSNPDQSTQEGLDKKMYDLMRDTAVLLWSDWPEADISRRSLVKGT